MDAQSLHNHIKSSTKQRIHAKPSIEPKEFDKNDEIINAEIHKEDADRDGDGVVSLIEELDNAEGAKVTAEEATAELNPEEPEEEKEEEPKDEDALPDASILTMKEDKPRSFNAFSSHNASAPVPQQNHQAPVEEAKPVKDNTTAIIMILLIAILVIAVAIFCVIVLGDYRKDREAVQNRTSTYVEPEKTEDETKDDDNSSDYHAIVGKWKATESKDDCYEIKSDSTMSFYSSCDNDKADYYKGSFKTLRGQSAIDSVSILKDRAARIVGVNESEIKLENIYIVSVTPDEYFVESNQSAKAPSDIKLLAVVSDENELRIYDYNYAELHVLVRENKE